MWPRTAVLAVLVLLILIGTPDRAQAATITVNTTTDVVNATDGLCSLREAITAANTDAASGATVGECAAGSGGDTVNLPAGTYTLTLGSISIASDLTLAGSGAAATVIQAASLPGIATARVFQISSVATAAVTGATVRYGNAVNGGGIKSFGTLTLENVIVSFNIAASGPGGGIYVADGNLTLISSTVRNNTSKSDGGGIFNSVGATLSVTDTLITDNASPDPGGRGGGVFNDGAATLASVTVSNNTTTSRGGGIFNDGTLTLTNGVVSANFSNYLGGGIATGRSATTTVADSLIRDNRVDNGPNSSGGAAVYNGLGKLDVTDTTVRDNSAIGSLSDGGGIYSEGTLAIANSTFNGNTADRYGGAIYIQQRTAALTNSTISGNSGSSAGGGIINNVGTIALQSSTVTENGAPVGGGVRRLGSGGITLTNTIVANSTSGGDCNGSMSSLGHNLDSDGSCGFGASGDLPNTSPVLGPLQDNGGPTDTHALLAGSPAIDAGDNAACPSADQRGITRPQGVACDIGAFELQSATPVPGLSQWALIGLAVALAGLAYLRVGRGTTGAHIS